MHDTIIVGGSYAGISAGLQLARAHREVLVLDAGQRRNRTATASHGFLGQDGEDPGAIAAKGRVELLAYPTVMWQDAVVVDARAVPGGFAVRAGADEHRGRRLVLATGVVDELPAIPGLGERWGRTVFHCPYCHAYELGRGPLAVLATCRCRCTRPSSSPTGRHPEGRPSFSRAPSSQPPGLHRACRRPDGRCHGGGRGRESVTACYTLVTRRLREPSEPADAWRRRRSVSDAYEGAGYRGRTGDIQLGKERAAIPGVSNAQQLCEKIRFPSDVGSHPTQPLAANSKKFAAGLLLETDRGGGGPDEPLLSVSDVARRLAVSKATVYRLCASGRLSHVRIMNVLRVRPADLRGFDASMRKAGL